VVLDRERYGESVTETELRKGPHPMRNLEIGFEFGDLIDSALVTAAFECLGEEDLDDFLGNAGTDDASAHRQHVGIVVLARHPSRIETVAERCADASHLVCSELFALTAAAEDDAKVGVAITHSSADTRADFGVIDRLGRVRSLVVDGVPGRFDEADQVLLEVVARMIGANCDSCHLYEV
jgi:hypothetical protein